MSRNKWPKNWIIMLNKVAHVDSSCRGDSSTPIESHGSVSIPPQSANPAIATII